MTIALSAACLAAASGADLDTAWIDELTGLKGRFNQPEGVYKVTVPRNDISEALPPRSAITAEPFEGIFGG